MTVFKNLVTKDLPPKWHHFRRFVIWFALTLIISLPVSVQPWAILVGDPQIDVWNHAWGYWFVYQSLLNGQLPLETLLVGAPGGGTLYYIDTPGAIVGLPLTALFGPAVSYNFVLFGRMALSALATQLLTESFFIDGSKSRPKPLETDELEQTEASDEMPSTESMTGQSMAGWLAGLGVLTLPFLISELNNGISEVCAFQWGIFALWAAQRCIQSPSKFNALLLGIFQGLTIGATFYYGMAFGLLLIFVLLTNITKDFFSHPDKAWQLLQSSVMAALIAILVASPYAWAFWYSIQSESRLVMRDTSLNEQLLRHNAVDPRIYLMWGHFQSVDLLKKYGEPFVHTAFLRWTFFPMAMYAGIKKTHLRIWLATMLLSLTFGLGNYLWWDENWVYIGSKTLSLPFEWMRQLLPQIAITHPLRLSIGGQVLCVALGLVGWMEIATTYTHKSSLLSKIPYLIAGFTIIESLLLSCVGLPIAHSNAVIPDFYEKIAQSNDARAVLDLPAEAGTSMKTSRYFWFQTEHERPIPYTPDVRLGSTRDLGTFKNFMGEGMSEVPLPLSDSAILHIRSVYQLIVVHEDLDAEKAALYLPVFTAAFGEATKIGTDYLWYPEALNDDEIPPEEQQETSSTPYSDQGEPEKIENPCLQPAKLVEKALVKTNEAQNHEVSESIQSCQNEILRYCVQRSKNNNVNIPEIQFCLQKMEMHPEADHQYAILHLFRSKNADLKIAVATQLQSSPNLQKLLPAERIRQLANQESPPVQTAMQKIFSEEIQPLPTKK